MKKKLKSFFTLKRKANDGFTLVELIVVVAILGILGGVGVPAYSGYVTKANKQADISLVSEVAHALTLYYYSHPDADLSTAWVKLDQEGTEATAGEIGDLAMQAVFGENWKEIVGLQYADWNGESGAVSYAGTSYYGNENSLLSEVDRLTDALGNAVKQYNIGLGTDESSFSTFLDGYGMSQNSDAQAIGNAAVLYVAQQTQGNEELIVNTFSNNLTSEHFINDTFNALSPKIGDAAALAAIYAYAEGFAQYCDVQEGSTTNAVTKFHEAADFSNTTDATSALSAIETAFNDLGSEGQNYVASYMATNGPGITDLNGYVDIMGTVNANKNIVEGNLAADDCFTDGTVENLLTGYAAMGNMGITTADGQIAVALTVQNGVPSTPVLPMNWNK